MTLSTYMNPAQFPLTSQKGLLAKQQFLIDAVNLDSLEAAKAEGEALTAEDLRRLAELQAKAKARPALQAEANATNVKTSA